MVSPPLPIWHSLGSRKLKKCLNNESGTQLFKLIELGHISIQWQRITVKILCQQSIFTLQNSPNSAELSPWSALIICPQHQSKGDIYTLATPNICDPANWMQSKLCSVCCTVYFTRTFIPHLSPLFYASSQEALLNSKHISSLETDLNEPCLKGQNPVLRL